MKKFYGGSFQSNVIIATIVLLIFITCCVAHSLYYAKISESYLPFVSACPDYWDDPTNDGTQCTNVHNLGLASTPNIVNFAKSPFVGNNCNKSTYCKNNNLTWDGITNVVCTNAGSGKSTSTSTYKINPETTRIILTLAFIFLYFLASKIISFNQLSGASEGHSESFQNFSFLSHSEVHGQILDWILNSGVCKLGKFAFFAWTIMLLFYLPLNTGTSWTYALFILACITVALTAVMNPPLFIRALPAFAVLFALLVVSVPNLDQQLTISTKS